VAHEVPRWIVEEGKFSAFVEDQSFNLLWDLVSVLELGYVVVKEPHGFMWLLDAFK
jgi:hypothetical protein